MNPRIKNIIAFLLATLILVVNIAELGALIHHWEEHQLVHPDVAADEHKDCKAFCSHVLTQSYHDSCDGHYLNFMPQIEFDQKNVYHYTQIELIVNKAIFFRVKQYSSSYTHLYTSRPPPALV